ncbi:MAG: hypothetical protein JNK85_11005 [Verrucomicrobiales bacterium]|nr:hypothetical protein [Verrucomicrobiales bacterium]
MAIVLPAVILGPVLSGVIHEMGHAVVVWAFGGRLHGIQPFWFLGAPHVHFEGEIGGAGLSLVYAAGVLAVLGVTWIAMLCVPFSKFSNATAVAWGIVLAALFTQIIAWAVLPILVLGGVKIRDDAVNFLEATPIHPAWVSVVSIALLAVTCAVFLRRTAFLDRFRALRAELEAEGTGEPPDPSPSPRLPKPPGGPSRR